MKGILSKSLSSPGRAAEKFPTPLMLRFLRTNVGSRSRGRSRSSPMFILRSSASKKNGGNTGPAVINETHQEPSSPKVTCIGQVRVKRSSKSKQKKKTHSEKPTSCSCCCCSGCSCCGFFSRTRFCCNFCPRFQKPRSICRNLRKWGWFFRFGYCKKVDTRDDSSSSSSRFGSNFRSGRNHVSSEIEDDNGERRNVMKGELVSEIKVGFLQKSSYSSPPKNALLLTRCRSAPYRSSSLASRFWGSPLKESETETPKENEDENEEDDEEEGGMGRPVSPNLENEEAESRTNDKNHEEDEENSSRNEESKDLNFQDLGEKTRRESSSTIHPLLLTRCKSEPARTGERLMNPEANFLLTQRRSDTAESCLNLPQIHC